MSGIPSWRRNLLPTYTRFQSPLHLWVPTIHGAFVPFVTADDADALQIDSLGPNPVHGIVVQRLETVNCLWDAATVLCGYLAIHGESVLNKCCSRFATPPSLFRIVEIGSGCGALGILAAKCLGDYGAAMSPPLNVKVIMTDMKDEIKVLQDTIAMNFDVVYELQNFDILIKTMNDLCPRRSPTLFLMAFERRWSDVTSFWWRDVKRAGWRWEIVSKAEQSQEWYGSVEAIDIVWMWKAY